MNIVFLITSMGSGGAERTVATLSKYMVERGHNISIVSIADLSFYEIDERVNYTTLAVSIISNGFSQKIKNTFIRYWRVNAFLLKNKPDVVISLLPEAAKYILFKKFALVTSERNYPAVDGNLKTKKKVFRKSDGIVFQTERARNWYPRDIQEKGVVIHNPVGNELVNQVPKTVGRKKKISAVGRLSKQKDYPTLLKAFKKVVEKHPEYRLEIFGGGNGENALKELAIELGLSESVSFMGVHRDAILRIADSTCYVMSSAYEGMPNALMEAMAIGLPCVSTDCPNGPAELVENEKNGLLVPVGDSNGMATAIIRMIEDVSFAEMCGNNAKNIMATHSVEKIAKQYCDYIEMIANKGK